ncbi:lipoprotein [Microtetraspora sp. NBRC 13810]|uniref:HNH endonuclease family protein n=1 Tax=Microtetraspora sp. NBRC 13810 TaxID=3030990 RepID=UPI0024A4F8B7|nr:HNH endonuclease family protein [Microtetraspora sp. NBRC 13810]GLW09331.1 lipoprotein [Microtetraspora sp. NBRC 13810]
MVIALVAGAIAVSLPASRDGGAGKAAGAVPLDNPDGTMPGLAPVASDAHRAEALDLIKGLPVAQPGAVSGYEPARYGETWSDNAPDVPFTGNGCDTRDDLLARDGADVRYQAGSRCVVTAMTLGDPYTGDTVTWRRGGSAGVRVDRVVPLSYGWRMGASGWPAAKRLRFANDPLNLLTVGRSPGTPKRGGGPAAWLPPLPEARCAYSVRFAQVAGKYDLPVTTADRSAMLAQCF